MSARLAMIAIALTWTLAACNSACSSNSSAASDSPSTTELADGAVQDDDGADPRYLQLLESLADQPVSGYVLIDNLTLKYPSLESARQAPGLEIRPGGWWYVHAVVEDHGDVVEVLPLVTYESWEREEHCYYRSYETGHLQVPGFIPKSSLTPVLAGDVEAQFDDGTAMIVRAGSGIASVEPFETIVSGLRLPLPSDIALSLSYVEPGPTFATYPAASIPFDDDWSSPPQAEQLPRIEGHTTLLLDDEQHHFWPGLQGRDSEILQVWNQEPRGEETLVTLHAPCAKVTARVDSHDIGSAGGGGRLVSPDDLPQSSRTDDANDSANPSFFVAPQDTPLYWEASGDAAGHLLASHHLAEGPRQDECFSPLQGFGDARICFAAEAVVETCSHTYCATEGLCSPVDGQCVAASDADCQRSANCSIYGQCSAVGGNCVATQDSECAQDPQCLELGHCGRDGYNRCVATTPQMCRDSQACREEGKCTLATNRCIIGNDEDCRQSAICNDQGRCSLDLEQVESPIFGGSVTLRRCIPADESDCSNSAWCTEYGYCHRLHQRYPPPPPRRSGATDIDVFSEGAMIGLTPEPPSDSWWCAPR